MATLHTSSRRQVTRCSKKVSGRAPLTSQRYCSEPDLRHETLHNLHSSWHKGQCTQHCQTYIENYFLQSVLHRVLDSSPAPMRFDQGLTLAIFEPSRAENCETTRKSALATALAFALVEAPSSSNA